ncbi:MAG: protease complex subunit PrcB family protein [Schaedlerella sp.]|uniref:protease complex subunit PrcB family protein n=1 Tax=Schaedlerella sp. TaxID=2676057 RepID=UPI00260C0FA5|nr:protease complex subunit PrcB family protein [uncultured Schaedlerella sp.]
MKHKRGIVPGCLAAGFLLIFMLTGCVSRPQKTEKLRDLEFTVMSKEDVPEEFQEQILQHQDLPFRLTYTDQGRLYIAEGYGAQLKTGYSVEVEGLYETSNAIYFHTNLLGPEKGEETKEVTTFPYVVVMLDAIDKTVVFDS